VPDPLRALNYSVGTPPGETLPRRKGVLGVPRGGTGDGVSHTHPRPERGEGGGAGGRVLRVSHTHPRAAREGAGRPAVTPRRRLPPRFPPCVSPVCLCGAHRPALASGRLRPPKITRPSAVCGCLGGIFVSSSSAAAGGWFVCPGSDRTPRKERNLRQWGVGEPA